MFSVPTEIQLSLAPTRRFQAIDVTQVVSEERGDVLGHYRRALYCSMHSTAGYLDQSLATRLEHRHDLLHQFFDAFRAVFPPGASYRHDQMHLRAELSAEQRVVEPPNADSHLTFIGAGLRNCVTYRNQPAAPVYFIDLDGTFQGTQRQRNTTIVAYNEERVVAQATAEVPVSRHPLDAINLADPRFGIIDAANDLLARCGLAKGRVDLLLDSEENDAGLTVNEYETLLMKHDLVEVLRNPLKYAKEKSRHILDDPLSVPSKTIAYARYDVVRGLNSLMEALRVDQSVVERIVAEVMAYPARRLLRSRKVTFLATDECGDGRPRLVRGTYQSPILIQWKPAERQARRIVIAVSQLY